MRIAALALVLIVASAVVLIFANTLNSWVLGGLIGGLAALLISIPISLIIFSALARRQDEHLHAQMLAQHEEDMAYDEYDEYNEYAEVYEAEAYVLPSEDEQFEQMRGRRQPEVRGLPAAGQSYASANQRPLNNPQGYRRFACRSRKEQGGICPTPGSANGTSAAATFTLYHAVAALSATRGSITRCQAGGRARAFWFPTPINRPGAPTCNHAPSSSTEHSIPSLAPA